MKRFFASVRPAQLLTALPPLLRRALLVGLDSLLFLSAVWLCFWLRHSHPFNSSFSAFGSWLLLGVMLMGNPVYAFTGQYKGLTPYVGSAAI